MKNEFTLVRIKRETLERLRKLADENDTTPPRMIDKMVKEYELDTREALHLHQPLPSQK